MAEALGDFADALRELVMRAVAEGLSLAFKLLDLIEADRLLRGEAALEVGNVVGEKFRGLERLLRRVITEMYGE